MSRCGCANTCSCQVNGTTGIGVSGTGVANDPYRVRFDPRDPDIVGPGLFWNEQDKELSTYLSGDAGNALAIGTDEGLWAPYGDGTGGPAPLPGGATVANLPAENVLCGMMGAGYLHVPENTGYSMLRATQLGLDAVYVPVRTLRDGISVAYTYDDTWLLNAAQGGPDDVIVADCDTQRWAKTPMIVGRYDPGEFDRLTGQSAYVNPVRGYFGFFEKPQLGGTFTSDVARLIGGRTVLVWHVTDGRESDDLRRVIQDYRLTDSCIVIAEDLTLLDPYRAMGITVGGLVPNRGRFTSNTPAAMQTAGCEWAFVSNTAGLSWAEMGTYRDAGLQCMSFICQYQSDQLTTLRPPPDGIGYRGSMTPDPVYLNGAQNGYVYRHSQSTWEAGTVEYGQFNHYRGWGEQQQPEYRGGRRIYHDSEFYTTIAPDWRHAVPDAGYDTTGPWWVLQGWACPIQPDANGSYTIAWWNRWRYLTEGYQNWCCLAFGLDYDISLMTGPRTGYSVGNSQCYVAAFEFSAYNNLSYFDDWRGVDSYTRYRFTNAYSGQRAPGLTPDMRDGELAQNAVESCYGVQVDALAGTVTLVQGYIGTSGRINATRTCYTHNELVHTGKYIYTGKVSDSAAPEADLATSITFRKLTVKPGVLNLEGMFPSAAV